MVTQLYPPVQLLRSSGTISYPHFFSLAFQRIQKTEERDFPNGDGGHWKTYWMYEALPLQGVEMSLRWMKKSSKHLGN